MRYYLTPRPPQDPIAFSYEDLEGKAIHAAELADALPYVRTATSWQQASNLDQLFAKISDPSLLRSAVLLDTIGPSHESGCSARSELDPSSTFTRIAVRIESTCRSIVVVQEIARPRWRGRIDGASAPVLRADLGFLALEVPAGTHLAELRYESATGEWWIASLAGVVILCLLCGAQIISRRERMTLARQTSAPA